MGRENISITMRVSLTIMGIALVAASMAMPQTTEDSIVPEVEQLGTVEPKVSAKASLTGSVSECAPGCPAEWIGDAFCDPQCDNTACGHDGGDCHAPGSSQGSGHDDQDEEMAIFLPFIHECQAKLEDGDVCKTLDPESCSPNPPPAGCQPCKLKLKSCVEAKKKTHLIGEYMEHPERIKDLIKSPAATLVSVDKSACAENEIGTYKCTPGTGADAWFSPCVWVCEKRLGFWKRRVEYLKKLAEKEAEAADKLAEKKWGVGVAAKVAADNKCAAEYKKSHCFSCGLTCDCRVNLFWRGRVRNCYKKTLERMADEKTMGYWAVEREAAEKKEAEKREAAEKKEKKKKEKKEAEKREAEKKKLAEKKEAEKKKKVAKATRAAKATDPWCDNCPIKKRTATTNNCASSSSCFVGGWPQCDPKGNKGYKYCPPAGDVN